MNAINNVKTIPIVKPLTPEQSAKRAERLAEIGNKGELYIMECERSRIKKNGFKKTYRWFIRQEVLKREIRNQILIQQSAEEWKKHNNGEGRHKNRTRLQLFRIQQKRLSNYNDEDLMRMFTKSLQGMVYK